MIDKTLCMCGTNLGEKIGKFLQGALIHKSGFPVLYKLRHQYEPGKIMVLVFYVPEAESMTFHANKAIQDLSKEIES